MFLVDALIGNWDRQDCNWGFLYDEKTDEMTIAPIYGCEGSLLSQSDETIIKGILKIPSQIDVYVYERPLSAIMENKQKIRYFDFIYSLKNKDCNEALKRIVPKIDLDKINKIIEETPCITDLQKKFIK